MVKKLPLRIDLHGIKGPAHDVKLGNAGGRGVSGGIENIELAALDHVDDAAAGDGLEAGYVKVLAERRLLGKLNAGSGGIEDAQAAAHGVGCRTGIDRAAGGADIEPVVCQRHLAVQAVSNGNRSRGGE